MVNYGCIKTRDKSLHFKCLRALTPSQVVESVQKEFGIRLPASRLNLNDPTKVSGKGLAKKWVDIFNTTRERFLNEISDIPIANKAYRLRVLQRMATAEE
jgi:hypothetical protein